MADFIKLFFAKSWEFFQIPWPGFNFTIGSVFLATLVSAGALVAFTKMTGASSLVSMRGMGLSGGNNQNIKISKDRKGDTK